jgi:hypothetical protein
MNFYCINTNHEIGFSTYQIQGGVDTQKEVILLTGLETDHFYSKAGIQEATAIAFRNYLHQSWLREQTWRKKTLGMSEGMAEREAPWREPTWSLTLQEAIGVGTDHDSDRGDALDSHPDSC